MFCSHLPQNTVFRKGEQGVDLVLLPSADTDSLLSVVRVSGRLTDARRVEPGSVTFSRFKIIGLSQYLTVFILEP